MYKALLQAPGRSNRMHQLVLGGVYEGQPAVILVRLVGREEVCAALRVRIVRSGAGSISWECRLSSLYHEFPQRALWRAVREDD